MLSELTYYCSENVFFSFLETRQLWLTSLTQSNDYAEGRWMRDHWLSLFREERSANSILAQRGAALCMDIASNESFALGVCFSEERDLLSQWRGYASDGAGYAITFDKEALVTVAKDHPTRLELTKIAYGDQDYEAINSVVRLLHAAFGDDARRYSESDGIGSLSLDFGPNGVKHQKFEEAARALFTVKNGAFREEKEWRLFTYGRLPSLHGVKIRKTGKALSPYIPITLPVEAVSLVTLGPTNQTPQHVLRFALDQNGFSEVRIRTSTASYRAR